VEKQKKIAASKKVRSYKRCLYYFEDTYRNLLIQQAKHGKGFIDLLNTDEIVEIVAMQKQLSPEDFDTELFNSITAFRRHAETGGGPQMLQTLFDRNNKQWQLTKLFDKPAVIDAWKNNDWQKVADWFGDVELLSLTQENINLLELNGENAVQTFDYLVAVFVAEFYNGLRQLIQSEVGLQDAGFQLSLKRIGHYLNLVYNEIMIHLSGSQGEIAYFFKLFMHSLYELEQALELFKQVFAKEEQAIMEVLRKEPIRENRRLEKVHCELDLNEYFECLLAWFESRSTFLQSSYDSMKLIYHVRRMFFSLLQRDNEYAFYLMKIARIHRKNSSDIILVNKLFRECEQHRHRLIEYELEFAKYIQRTKNAHEAYQYLSTKEEEIKTTTEQLFKKTRFGHIPERVYERAKLYMYELQIKIDSRNEALPRKFYEFMNKHNDCQWERPMFKYAQFLDFLDI